MCFNPNIILLVVSHIASVKLNLKLNAIFKGVGFRVLLFAFSIQRFALLKIISFQS
jgi:hypothetical protein